MGPSVPIRLPTIPRHELMHLARTGQLQPLLSGISDTQAFVSSDVPPGGGLGMPSEETSALSAQENKMEQSRTVKGDGVQGKAVVKEFKWPLTKNCHPRR
jgi:chitinase